MNSLFAPSAALAAATPLLDPSSALIAAARLLLPDLERGRAIDAKTLRACYSACKIDPLSRGIGVQN
jgi:hypothetical protein